MNIGDRVYAWYRQHSIPTRSPGSITNIERGVRPDRDLVTVKLDHPDLETGDLVCVQMPFIEPCGDGA